MKTKDNTIIMDDHIDSSLYNRNYSPISNATILGDYLLKELLKMDNSIYKFNFSLGKTIISDTNEIIWKGSVHIEGISEIAKQTYLEKLKVHKIHISHNMYDSPNLYYIKEKNFKKLLIKETLSGTNINRIIRYSYYNT